MPVLFSYNVQGPSPQESNRIQSLFERLGWQNVGGSSYRYPPLSADPTAPEDWLNHVVPALMAFRAFVLNHPHLTVPKFSLDIQTSTGYDQVSSIGSAIAAATVANFAPPNTQAFGAQNLEDWINNTTTSCPYP